MKKNNNELILLLEEDESEYLDFKEQYTDNNAEFIHDILCLANSETHNHKYLIVGINDKTKNIVGVKKDMQKTPEQVIDILRNSNFNRLPNIKFKTIDYQGKQVDFLEIENASEKPYFLLKDKQVGQKRVRAGVIYTRIERTNTAIDSCADDHSIEKMYRERFGYNKLAIDRVKDLLIDYQNWQSGTLHTGERCFFHNRYPDYGIARSKDSSSQYEEPWVKIWPDKGASINLYNILYNQIVLDRIAVIYYDGARYFKVLPERYQEQANNNLSYNFGFYYIDNSIEQLADRMIRHVMRNISSYIDDRDFYSFNNKLEAENAFHNSIISTIKEYNYYTPVQKKGVFTYDRIGNNLFKYY